MASAYETDKSFHELKSSFYQKGWSFIISSNDILFWAKKKVFFTCFFISQRNKLLVIKTLDLIFENHHFSVEIEAEKRSYYFLDSIIL